MIDTTKKFFSCKPNCLTFVYVGLINKAIKDLISIRSLALFQELSLYFPDPSEDD